MQCCDFRDVADSYLSDELLVETNHDVITHLEDCADCRRELAARRDLRTILQSSFASAADLQISGQFAARLHRELHEAVFGATLRPRAWMVAAGFLVIVTFGLVVVWQRQRAQTDAEPATQHQTQKSNVVTTLDPQTTQADLAADALAVLKKMAELAAGDHRDCAIRHRLPDPPITLTEASLKVDRAYLDLTKAVIAHRNDFKEVMEIVMAHACVFNGRWFAHIVVRHRGRLVSLLVTRLEDPSAGGLPKKGSDEEVEGQVIACATEQGYQISCFHTARHAVLVVSDLEQEENLGLARRLAPSIYKHLTQAERLA